MSKKITVVGAGIIGLTTALTLRNIGHQVSVIASNLSPHTTSDRAGAFWFPYHCNPRDKALVWMRKTIEVLTEVYVPIPESGCKLLDIEQYFDTEVGEVWWKDVATSYRELDKSELPLGYLSGFRAGIALMDTSLYMPFLTQQCLSSGISFEQKVITDIKKEALTTDVMINCTGLGSKKLCRDDDLHPIRGQVLIAEKIEDRKVTIDADGHNHLAFVVPRGGDTVLGGTEQVDDWNEEEDTDDTRSILEHTKAINPLVRDVNVQRIVVGLRPGRSAVRLEIEKDETGVVIHNYGHGGGGFTLSWGCAEEVASLVDHL